MGNLWKQLRPTGGKYKGAGGGNQRQAHGEDDHCLHDDFVDCCKQHFYVASINTVTMKRKMH
jgi:hypothetical protein